MNTSNNSKQHRIVVLDTETTGMNREGGPHYQDHRIIEIGAVEIIDRKLTGRHFHVYIKPDREIQPDAVEVHGITDEFLVDKPEYKMFTQSFLNSLKMLSWWRTTRPSTSVLWIMSLECSIRRLVKRSTTVR